MASKEEILGILAGESGAMSKVVLGKRLGLPTSSFQNQLDRMEKQGLIEKNEQNEYTITDAGHQFALAEPPPPPGETPPGEATEESLKTTEYQQFIEIGRQTGVVPLALIGQTANHVWRGGDFRDLTWVWKGLVEMGIRSDLAQRWFHSWRSFLHQSIPPHLASVTTSQIAEGATPAKEAVEVGKGKRDYIFDVNGLPLYVGEGVGDLDHDEAVRLSALRQAALARGGIQTAPGGQPATPGTMADEVVKIFNAFKETMGPQTKGKSYIVKPGEEGYVVEEVEEGKPTVVTPPGQGGGTPSPSFLVDAEGNVTEVAPGRPVVIKQATPSGSIQPSKTFIVRQTPEGIVAEEHDLGKPIIINVPSSLGPNMPPILPFPVMGSDNKPLLDQDGHPVYANLEPMLKWQGFQDDRRRADERHSTLMGLVQTVRENFGDGIAALKAAAEEAKAGSKTSAPPPQEQPVYECSSCHIKFNIPAEEGWERVACPGCGTEWTREQVMST